MTSLYTYTQEEVLAQSGKPMANLSFLAGSISTGTGTLPLVFHGIRLTFSQIASWLGQVAISIIFVLLSTPIYSVILSQNKTKRATIAQEVGSEVSLTQYKPIVKSKRAGFLVPLRAEMKLMMSGLPKAWYFVAVIGMVLSATLPITAAWMALLILPVWCIGVFSEMGSREYENDTLSCVSVLPGGRLRQIFCSWFSGLLILMVLSLPMILRQTMIRDFSIVFSIFSGIVFIPSLALFLGEWTRSRRTFSVVFLILAYLNLNGIPALMYFENRLEYLSFSHSCIFLLLGFSLAATAIWKRSFHFGSNLLV
jgi:hypothetical protein